MQAQKYIVDSPVKGYVWLNDRVPSEGMINVWYNNESGIANGDTVTVTGRAFATVPGDTVRMPGSRIFAKLDHRGKTAYCEARFLRFLEDANPEGTEDILAASRVIPYNRSSHGIIEPVDLQSTKGRMLYGRAYPAITGVLMLLAVVMLLFGKRHLVFLLSILPFIVSLLMVLYLMLYLGSDLTWWCNAEYFLKGDASLRAIPMALYLGLATAYGLWFIGKKDEFLPSTPSFTYTVIGIVAFFPIFFFGQPVLGLFGLNIFAGHPYWWLTLCVGICVGLPMLHGIIRCGMAGLAVSAFYLFLVYGVVLVFAVFFMCMMKIIWAFLMEYMMTVIGSIVTLGFFGRWMEAFSRASIFHFGSDSERKALEARIADEQRAAAEKARREKKEEEERRRRLQEQINKKNGW